MLFCVYCGEGIPEESNDAFEIACPSCGLLVEAGLSLPKKDGIDNIALVAEESDIIRHVIDDKPYQRNYVNKVIPSISNPEHLKGDIAERSFKRYRIQAEVTVRANDEAFKGKIIDYSDGICTVIEDAPPLAPDTTIEIESFEPEIELLGKVVWIKKMSSGLIIGARRVDNFRGSLRDFKMTDILIGLQKSSRTGILEIRDGPIQKNIYIENGEIIFATSNHTEDRIGHILLNAGKITVAEHNESVALLKKTGKSQGTTLVELGYATPHELVWAVKHRVFTIIQVLFTVKRGSFEFQEGPIPSEEAMDLKIVASNHIYYGIKRIEDLLFLKKECPQVDTVLSLSMDPSELSHRLSLDDTDKRIFPLINGKNSIKEILSLSHLTELDTFRTIYALLSIGAIESKKEHVARETHPREETVSEPVIEINVESVNKIKAMYNNCETLGYYEVLGVKDWASENKIKEAYQRLSKEFHPDRHISLQSDDIKEKLNIIFTYITEAYKTLSDPEKRKEYNESITAKPKRTVSNVEMARIRFNEGKSEMMVRNYIKAEKLLAQAIYLDSSEAIYHFHHGIALAKLKLYKEAAKAVEQAIILRPQKTNYLVELGHIFLKLGFNKRAKTTFEKALEISPSNKMAINGLKKSK